MADTKIFLDFIFKKDKKNVCKMRQTSTSFLCPRTRKRFPLIIVYWKCPGLCTFFFKTSTWYLAIVYALLRRSLDFYGQFRFFPMLMPKPCSGYLKFYLSISVKIKLQVFKNSKLAQTLTRLFCFDIIMDLPVFFLIRNLAHMTL